MHIFKDEEDKKVEGCCSVQDFIFDDLPPKAQQWQVTTVDGQRRKVMEPKRREVDEDGLWEASESQTESLKAVPAVAEAVPEAHKRHMADSEKEKGNEAFYSRDYDEAEAYYTRSLQYMADDPSTWSNRALVESPAPSCNLF